MELNLELTDIYLIAFLKLHNINIMPMLVNERVVFRVPDSEKTRKLIENYNNGVSVSVSEFVSSIKQIRAIIFALKNGHIRGPI